MPSLNIKYIIAKNKVGDNMNKISNISPTEYEIMEFLWTSDRKLLFKEIFNYVNESKKKNWKKQTLNFFLKSLQDKGFVISEPQGNKLLYYPKYSKEEFDHILSHRILENSFENSIIKFFTAFTGGKKLNQEDEKYLKEYLQQYENSEENNSDNK